MIYSVKEIFYSLQGEGFHSGRPAVFCRFSGCNLWNGKKDDQANSICTFCDTDFVGTDGEHGGKYASPRELVQKINSLWPQGVAEDNKFVVLTGGEPLLQVDVPLIIELHAQGFYIAVETNGTQLPPPGLDWICVSPKMNAGIILTGGNELKLVYPQPGGDPAQFEDLEFEHFYLQPMDGPDREKNTRLAVEYCLRNPKWKLSLQTHKYLGIQ
ncbi:MAG: 7-carboxy-7-deazaguanine synthase [Calditrichia bacterium]